ncbi:MAG TPA: hypothetical protein VHG91_03960 [Longimicrobium sp.]|nr:hypothetical protein [Longimicrobium sp.]
MRKLKLHLEELAVESFATHGAGDGDGTVRAHEISGARPASYCFCSERPDSICLCTAEADADTVAAVAGPTIEPYSCTPIF